MPSDVTFLRWEFGQLLVPRTNLRQPTQCDSASQHVAVQVAFGVGHLTIVGLWRLRDDAVRTVKDCEFLRERQPGQPLRAIRASTVVLRRKHVAQAAPYRYHFMNGVILDERHNSLG
ncbi:MAG TPA: hypothetical protein VMF30_16925 [Pirellulales bacterium]|nr:hypothetical protein [Pirellulales bacterium]